MARNRTGWPLVALALLLLAVFAGKGVLMVPPQPPRLAAAGEFDTGRAIARLQRILGDQRPHPVDTAADDAVRGRLISELRAIGLDPKVRDMVDCSGFPKVRSVRCSHVRNVVAVLDGPARPALLINAHYDSTPVGPGAADDGIGVAAMIEVAALVKDRPRARPIILLFNESEEYGLNGANAFVEQDPLARHVGRLINIEARGVNGPALMFETSRPNAQAIRDFAASAHRPYANSLSTDFATLIPNTTDVVKFRPAGWEILNYAIIGNETRYHSPGDNIASLSRDSLYHMGSDVMAATERLAEAQPPSNGGTIVYSDVAGRLFLHLPLMIAAAMLALLFLAALALCLKRRCWRAVAAVAGAWLVSCISALALAWLSGLLRPGDYWRSYPLVPNLAGYATAIAVLTTLMARIAARTDRAQLRLASWTLILIVGGATSAFLPGGSIYFLIGPALALTGIAAAPRNPAFGRTLALAGALIQLLMFAEMLGLIEMLLVDGPLAAGSPLPALAALPLLAEVARTKDRRFALVLGALTALLWLCALVIPRATAERPLSFTVTYYRDDVRRTAQWAINSKQAPLPPAYRKLGAWRFGKVAYSDQERWLARAPLLEVTEATLAQSRSIPQRQGRLVLFRLRTNGADAVTIRFDDDVPVLAIGRSGQLRRLDQHLGDTRSALGCSGRSCDGMEFAALIGTRDPVEATIISQHFSPPTQAAQLLAHAPRWSQPQYAPNGAVRVSGTTL